MRYVSHHDGDKKAEARRVRIHGVQMGGKAGKRDVEVGKGGLKTEADEIENFHVSEIEVKLRSE